MVQKGLKFQYFPINVKLRLKVILVSKPVHRLELKDQISYLDKSCIIYKFNCFCQRSFIRRKSRHLKTRANKHITKCVLKFKKETTTNKTKYVINATKSSSIAEHLINNLECANNYDL